MGKGRNRTFRVDEVVAREGTLEMRPPMI